MIFKNSPGGNGDPEPKTSLSISGFTLIEVLIATALLAALLALAGTSFSTFTGLWNRKSLADHRFFERYRDYTLVRSALESTWDYYITSRIRAPSQRWYIYFQGKPKTLTFVTLSSVFHPGRSAVARLRLEKKNHTSTSRLIYEETGLKRKGFRYAARDEDFTERMVLAEGVEKIGLRYYGVNRITFIPGTSLPVEQWEWQPTFDGQRLNRLPRRIELSLSTKAGDWKLLYELIDANAKKSSYLQSGNRIN